MRTMENCHILGPRVRDEGQVSKGQISTAVEREARPRRAPMSAEDLKQAVLNPTLLQGFCSIESVRAFL